MKIARLFLFLWLIFGANTVFAQKKLLKMELTAEGLEVGNINTQVLQKMFNDYGYEDYIYMPNWKYPPIFLDELPYDFDKIKDKNLRNRLFLQIMVPLTMLANERILSERGELISIQNQFEKNQDLSDIDKKNLEVLAQKYDVFTRMKGQKRYELIIKALSKKIDVVPPSILIAVAAAESNWGTAREVKLGNALYKKKIWYRDEGIKPLDDKDESYRIKIYPNLMAAIDDYALQINNDVNFEQFRSVRENLRQRQETLKGRSMAYLMVSGSPLENYAGMIDYIITFYDLANIDEAELGRIDMLRKKK